jgi:hypothetical protein
MTRKFASVELARLYETQGYIQDALAMYRSLEDDALAEGAEVRAAVKRLELTLLKRQSNDRHGEPPADSGQAIAASLAALNRDVECEEPVWSPEQEQIARLMERWLALLVVRKRLLLFKRIRARV